MRLIDKQDQTADYFIPIHKQNASDGSHQTKQEDIDLMSQRVADVGIASSVFNMLCTPS